MFDIEDFNPRSTRKRHRHRCRKQQSRHSNFNPRSTRKRHLGQIGLDLVVNKFQSTLYAQATSNCTVSIWDDVKISIHALRASDITDYLVVESLA